MEIENDSARYRLLGEIAVRREKIDSLYRINPIPIDQIKSVRQEIRNLQESYCAAFSYRYRDIVAEYEIFTLASLDAYARLVALENRVMLAQTGVEPDIDKGMFGLAQVKAYLDKLASVYQYNIIDPVLFPEEIGIEQ
jgi:hypothetical protein